MINVFLVEDEPPALRKLERMVTGIEDLAICGTATTCASAITSVLRTKPQLLIVDVRLPDGTGFEVLQALDEPPDLHAVFLTAYDQYAVQAFEIAAGLFIEAGSAGSFSASDRTRPESISSPAAPIDTKVCQAASRGTLESCLSTAGGVDLSGCRRSKLLSSIAKSENLPCARPWMRWSSGWIPWNSPE